MGMTSGPTALITGVAGQDGVYLARHLVDLGYRVVGTVRPTRGAADRTGYLADVDVVELDQLDSEGFASTLEDVRPDEIYNLAGFTSVGASWGHAEVVAETNGMAVLRILEELIRYRDRHGAAPRYFQPSSSEMFGVTDQQPQTEGTPHHPRSPYAATKSFAHHLTVNYRESYELFTTTGTLYNHESPLRGPQFVTRKITRSVAEIALGLRTTLSLGNLDVRRDWGFAADYARAMHLMLQLDEPQDFIIATGQSRPLSEVLRVAFDAIGISDPGAHVHQDPALMRPADVVDLYGDPTKAREQLGWEPTLDFEAVIEHMVRIDVERLRSGVEEAPAYLFPAPDRARRRSAAGHSSPTDRSATG
ncbi:MULTISPECIES: GDP-mannose 4,6-dehydratase [unclassified Nocardioides]|uniref:GDP-mannose 4,6-dehydratase n=1 Tax=unclassified Nocardioides TaxID=2615069 RepID=UPI0009EF93D9|nr:MULTISPECIES: GDP-mannose 4,6-dehydratase [unclassified Nocardioides]GAW51922.1 GDP-mannose 4,6-dehydratase [Nocardioides sp. PD653-B2]GAW57600.1 GDP-mannose 4,6-dehydratase [Nocardioides sp. PD653]